MNKFEKFKLRSSFDLSCMLEGLKSDLFAKERELLYAGSPAAALPLEIELAEIKKDIGRIYFILKARKNGKS